MWLPSLPLEMLIGLLIGLIPALVEMNWELRTLGVIFTAGLAAHIAKRLEAPFAVKIAFGAIAIGVLLAGTWHPIWIGFHDDFPGVTRQAVLARIIEFSAVATSGIAAYLFIVRPLGKRNYKVLPAQIIAFGICLIGVGFFTALAGLGWQFQQNWAAGTTPSGAPIFTVGPPQITQNAPPPALPPPSRPEQTTFFSSPEYNLTGAGVTALAEELFKSRDALGRRIELDRMNTDGTSQPFYASFERACDQAGIECPPGTVHPNSPDEKGLLIYVADPNKPPAAAEELQSILQKLGIDVPFVTRPGFAPTNFSLFIGPRA